MTRRLRGSRLGALLVAVGVCVLAFGAVAVIELWETR